MDSITLKANATRRRRQARGQYVTKEQKLAFAHLMQRDGRKSLSRAECEALAGHSGLTVAQRAEFKAMAEDKAQL